MGVINQAKNLFRDKITGGKRSSKWPAVEKAHLKQFPTCAACGSSMRLNVHHIQPFHTFPEKELDPTNLITLCMDPKAECHILLGHGGDFKEYNPNIREDAAVVLASVNKFESLKEEAAKARADRLKN